MEKKKQVTCMWEMTVDVAEEFWKRCMDRQALTEESKIKILEELAAEGKIKSIIATTRSKKQIIEDKMKEYNVLDLTDELKGD